MTLVEGITSLSSMNPLAWADIAAHMSVGYSLTKSFFPESTKIKTLARTLIGGFLPDSDFGLEIVTGNYHLHRGLTHTFLATPLLASAYSLFEKQKANALKLGLIGAMTHILIDSTDTLEGKLAYGTVALGGLAVKKYKDYRELSPAIENS